MSFGVGAPENNPTGRERVLVAMQYDASAAPWLAPNIRLALSMTPAEARSMAQALIRMADKARG
jgi:hypothetical protein